MSVLINAIESKNSIELLKSNVLEGIPLSPGQLISGKVDSVSGGGRVILNLAGRSVEALTEVTLLPGQEVNLEVMGRINGRLHLRLANDSTMTVSVERGQLSSLLADSSLTIDNKNEIVAVLLDNRLPVTEKNLSSLIKVANTLARMEVSRGEAADAPATSPAAASKAETSSQLKLAGFILAAGLIEQTEVWPVLKDIYQRPSNLGASLDKLLQGLSDLGSKPLEQTPIQNPGSQPRLSVPTGRSIVVPESPEYQPLQTGQPSQTAEPAALPRVPVEGRNSQPAATGQPSQPSQTAKVETALLNPINQPAPPAGSDQPAPAVLPPPDRSSPAGQTTQGLLPGRAASSTDSVSLPGQGIRTAEEAAAPRAATDESTPAAGGDRPSAGDFVSSKVKPQLEVCRQLLFDLLGQSPTRTGAAGTEFLSGLLSVMEVVNQPGENRNQEEIRGMLRDWLALQKPLAHLLNLLGTELTKEEARQMLSPAKQVELLLSTESSRLEAVAQQVINTIDKSQPDQPDFYYFSWPMLPPGSEHQAELRVYRQKDGRKPLNLDDLYLVFQLQTPNLGISRFDLHLKQRVMEFKVTVEKEEAVSLVKAAWPDLARRLQDIGYDARLLDCKPGSLESIRPRLEEKTPLESLRRIDVLV